MHNPFPGMNPYLEQPGLWPQVHNRLIVALADVITPKVAPKYRVSIEERVYTTTDPLPPVGIADVALAQRGEELQRSEATAQLTVPRRVQVPLPVELTERFLEVRLVQTNLLVCVIEVLSPTNKRVGEGRTAYEAKRQKILASATHLVEIDLLRGEPPLPLGDPDRKPYSILVSRSGDRPNAELYEFDLPDPIPCFPVPLQADDIEPVVDLQQVVNELYSRARFDLAIDYSQPVKPDLSEPETSWITGILTT
ncbi:DUF4058 family protein [Nodosilinea sp. PGN35]|uniref:DUF4058 family protein n=1 Tax=Nodosilinea sp. PGN35 TaxID=3020489 RepID=UPI0023B22C2C|nr:DUF4058 family protein [Nodosilinea sp. TSF1-S3]MDF0366799.1 DUF4058 family protein [Nodosilinea sp. TSF1-S3]